MTPKEQALQNFKEAEQNCFTKYGSAPKDIIINALKTACALTIKNMQDTLAEYDKI